MSDQDFILGADFDSAIRQFQKLVVANQKLVATGGQLVKTFQNVTMAGNVWERLITKVSTSSATATKTIENLGGVVKATSIHYSRFSHNLGAIQQGLSAVVRSSMDAKTALIQLKAISGVGAATFDSGILNMGPSSASRARALAALNKFFVQDNIIRDKADKGLVDRIFRREGLLKRLAHVADRAIAGDKARLEKQRRIVDESIRNATRIKNAAGLGFGASGGAVSIGSGVLNMGPSAASHSRSLSALNKFFVQDNIIRDKADKDLLTRIFRREGLLKRLSRIADKAIARDRIRLEERRSILAENIRLTAQRQAAAAFGFGVGTTAGGVGAPGSVISSGGFMGQVPDAPTAVARAGLLKRIKQNLVGIGTAAKKTDSLLASIGFFQTARYFALFRGLSAIKDGFVDISKAAQETSKRIKEILTISQGSGFTFGDFEDQITAISNATGLAAEDVAEGTYQALSNQIVDAAESFEFLSRAGEFAVVTNSTLSDSVDVLSSSLRSYGDSAILAERNAAILFKSIEIGRFRAEDIAPNLGTVTAQAGILGIDMRSVGAALATITTNGVKANRAMTELRALFQKLIKPTKEMRELLDSMGVDSAKAAISIKGFGGFLDEMFEVIDNNSEKFGTLFSRTRAISGAIKLAGGATESFVSTLKKFGNELDSFAEARRIAFEDSAPKELERQFQQIRNILVGFGRDVIKVIANISKTFVTLRSGFLLIIAAIINLTIKWTLLKVIVSASTKEGLIFRAMLFSTTLATKGLTAALAAVNITMGTFLLSIGAIIGTGLVFWFLNGSSAAKELADEIKNNLNKAVGDLTNKLAKDLGPAMDDIKSKFKPLLLLLTELRKGLFNDVTNSTLIATNALETFIDSIDDVVKANDAGIKRRISKEKSLQKAINETVKLQKDQARSKKDQEFEKRVGGLSVEDQILEREARIAKNRFTISSTSTKTEFGIKKASRLNQQIISDLKLIAGLRKESDTAVRKDISVQQSMDTRIRNRRILRLEEIRKTKIGGVGSSALERLNDEERTLIGQISSGQDTIDSRRKSIRPDSRIRDAEAFSIKLQIELVSLKRAQVTASVKERRVIGDQNVLLKEQLKTLKDSEATTLRLFIAASAVSGILGFSFAGNKFLAAQGAAIGAEQKLTRADKLRRDVSSTEQNETSIAQKDAEAIRAKFTNTTKIATALSGIPKFGFTEFPMFGGDAGELRQLFGPTKTSTHVVDRFRKMGISIGGRIEDMRQTGGDTTSVQFSKSELKEISVFAKAASNVRTTGLKSPSKGLVEALKTINDILNPKVDESVLAIRQNTKALQELVRRLSAMQGGGSVSGVQGRAHGGFGGAGGVFHPGEFVVNKRATTGNRGLLELLNRSPHGNLGQFGGRTGAIPSDPFMSASTGNRAVMLALGDYGPGILNPFGGTPLGQSVVGSFSTALRTPIMPGAFGNPAGSIFAGNTQRASVQQRLNGTRVSIGDININGTNLSVREISREVVKNIRRDISRGLARI